MTEIYLEDGPFDGKTKKIQSGNRQVWLWPGNIETGFYEKIPPSAEWVLYKLANEKVKVGAKILPVFKCEAPFGKE